MTLSVFPWTPGPTDRNCMFFHCDRFPGSSAHSMGTRYWTQTTGAERKAVFQACQTAFSSAQFGSTPTLQIVKFKKCHHGVVNHSRLTVNILTGITSATRIHFYLLCHVTTPPLLAAKWSVDHNKMAAFTVRWMVLHQYCIICMAADGIYTCEGSVPRDKILCLGTPQVAPRDGVQEKGKEKRKYILHTLCR